MRSGDILTHSQRKAIEAFLISLCYNDPVETLRIVRDQAKILSMSHEARLYSAVIELLEALK